MIGISRWSGFCGAIVSTNGATWRRGVSHGGHVAIQGIARREPRVVHGILKHMEATRSHMTPEIELFLLTANCSLYHEPFQSISEGDPATRNLFTDPFWSIYWPGGQALARFVLDEGRRLFSSPNQGRTTVLDVGAGCGAVAIAAKRVGANRVVANDIDKVACTAIRMNAALNHVELEVSQENLLRRPFETPADVVLIGDMLYDEEIAGSLIPWIEKARRRGSRIYLGDPGRHGLTSDLKSRLRLLREYPLPESVQRENYGYVKCDVWEFLG